MPHTMVTFRLHRSGVILLVVFCVILAVLIYAAGYLTASYRSQSRSTIAKPKVTKKATPPPRKTQPAKNAEPYERLMLRVAVLTNEEDAKALVATLTADGFKAAIIPMPTPQGVVLHSVVVGHYETRSAANKAAEELQSQLGYLPAVVPAPPPPKL